MNALSRANYGVVLLSNFGYIQDAPRILMSGMQASIFRYTSPVYPIQAQHFIRKTRSQPIDPKPSRKLYCELGTKVKLGGLRSSTPMKYFPRLSVSLLFIFLPAN
jgi:hypothetical protein